MRPVLLSQIAQWCEARLMGDDLSISHVSTDTRDLNKGSLFVALRGETTMRMISSPMQSRPVQRRYWFHVRWKLHCRKFFVPTLRKLWLNLLPACNKVVKP